MDMLKMQEPRVTLVVLALFIVVPKAETKGVGVTALAGSASPEKPA